MPLYPGIFHYFKYKYWKNRGLKYKVSDIQKRRGYCFIIWFINFSLNIVLVVFLNDR
jgi:hypothetical protein